MHRSLAAFLTFAAALVLPLAAHADPIDDFVLTGAGNTITFSLPASPPGNLSTCPTNVFPIACLPGSETAFYLSAPVTTDGVTALGDLAFPTFRFGAGLEVNGNHYAGQMLFLPDAANPTFLLGTFDLGYIDFGDPNPNDSDYTLTITQETTTSPVPEPSSVALFATGIFGLIGLAAIKHRSIVSFH